MRLKDYLRASGWDFLLCLVISIAVGFINCGGFMVNDSLHTSPLALLLSCAIPLVLMFATASSKKTVLPGIGAIIILLAIAVFVAHVISGNTIVFADTEKNSVIFILVMFCTSMVTFLMTRRKWLARAFVPVAIIDMCFVEFMYKQGYWPAVLIALIALGTMAVFRNYRTNLRDSSTDKVSFTSAFGVGITYAVILTGIACLVFFLVIAPMNPAAKELKLFTKYMTFETVELTGVGGTNDTPDDKTTNQLNDQLSNTKQNPDDEGNQKEKENESLSPLDIPALGSLLKMATNGAKALKQMFNYLIENPSAFALFWIAVLIILSLPYLIKKRLRARWFAKTCALSPQERVETFYRFFIKRFEILKVVKPKELTLSEWAGECGSALHEFEENEMGATFAQLTQIYCDSAYGKKDPTDEELDSYLAFYRHFYKAFISKCGRFKYCLKFFRV